ncbi:MAG TPA: 30S ribosomal protein S17 [candidate division Zixibacteria bacterium]|nr:30S ribosomal protein S17 [candidate division Zixibacteria bacterium]
MVAGRRRTLEGVVISDKMDKTITVLVERLTPHPLYDKIIKRRTKVKAHDPKNEARVGDVVRIIESRPFSKTKRWALVAILRRAVETETGGKK